MPRQNSKHCRKGKGRECKCRETDRAKNQAKKARPTIRTLVTTLLLNVSSTTEPIQHRIGSVVELTFNMDNGWDMLAEVHVVRARRIRNMSLFMVFVGVWRWLLVGFSGG